MLFLLSAPQIPRRTNQSGLPVEFEKTKFSKNHTWEQWLPEVSGSQRKDKHPVPTLQVVPETPFYLTPRAASPPTGGHAGNEE